MMFDLKQYIVDQNDAQEKRVSEVATYVPPKMKGKNKGDVWQIKKPSGQNKFGAMNQVSLARYFKTKEEAEKWATGKHPPSYSGHVY